MQRLIYLRQQQADNEDTKLSKKEAAALQQKQFVQSVASFKQQMIAMSKSFKLVKDLPPEVILIEYSDEIAQEMYEALRSIDVVEIIDSIIPENIDDIDSSDNLSGAVCWKEDDNVEDLRNKMSRYMK